MSFPPEFLDNLRARLPVSSVVGKRVRLAKKGREYSGLCPFHNEKSPSFFVNDEKGFYHCFGCGAHGDAIGFVMQSDNLGFAEAIERLAGEAGLEVPKTTPSDPKRAERLKTLHSVLDAAARWFQDELARGSADMPRAYLARRGLSAETVEKFRLGWAPDRRDLLKKTLLGQGFPLDLQIEAGLLVQPDDAGAEPYDRFRGRVMFPIQDRRGAVIAFGGRVLGDGQPKYLNSPETPIFHKGRVLYGLHHARGPASKSGQILVVEGYMDVVALHQGGLPIAVAPLGTALTEEHAAELWRLAAEPTLCFDGDAAGQRAAARAAERLLPLLSPGCSLRFVTLPEGVDPDDLIRQPGGLGRLRQAMTEAQPLIDRIWDIEATAAPHDTPEQRAGLLARLRTRARSIADPDIRQLYGEALTARFDASFRPVGGGAGSGAGGGGAPTPRPRFERGPRGWQPVRDPYLKSTPKGQGKASTARRLQERAQFAALLAALLRHPALIGDMQETLAAVSLDDSALDRVKDRILEAYTAAPDLDSAGIRAILMTSATADVTADAMAFVLSRDVQNLLPSSRSGDPLTAARIFCAGMVGGLVERRLAVEKRDRIEAAKADGDAASLARLRALLDMQAEGPPDPGRDPGQDTG